MSPLFACKFLQKKGETTMQNSNNANIETVKEKLFSTKDSSEKMNDALRKDRFTRLILRRFTLSN